jgi:hypothetical protein
METLEETRRYQRPEHESRIESMSQDLEDLCIRVDQSSAASDAAPFQSFTGAEVQSFQVRLASLNAAESNIFADKIVASLNYDTRPVRHSAVAQAHKDTFQWAFDSRLSHWLRSGSGIFWVSGKPGKYDNTSVFLLATMSQLRQ